MNVRGSRRLLGLNIDDMNIARELNVAMDSSIDVDVNVENNDSTIA